MRILTYKRTHVGDPDVFGRFGINDCMGRVRGYRYDAVIGVGGAGWEARRHGIDRKITWVGIGPKRKYGGSNRRAAIIEFEHFVLFDRVGPPIGIFAPNLSNKIYDGRRYILDSYSDAELSEAIDIVDWARRIPDSRQTTGLRKVKRNCRKSRLLLAKRNNCCRKLPNPPDERGCVFQARSVSVPLIQNE